MSLLMEALKKAEQEKKEAAKRIHNADVGETTNPGVASKAESEEQDTSDIGLATQENFIDPIEDTGPHPMLSTMELKLEPIEQQQQAENEAAAPVAKEEIDINQTLDVPLDGIELDPNLALNVDEPEQTQEFQSSAVAESAPVPDNTVSENIVEEASAPSLEQTFYNVELDTQQAAEAVENQEFQDTLHDNTVDQVPNYDETLPGVSAEQLSKDIGESDLPTPVAAQTVFSASASQQGGGLNWPLYLGLAAMMLVAVGVVIYVSMYMPRGGSEQLAIPKTAIELSQQVTTQTITPVTELDPSGTDPNTSLSGTVSGVQAAPGETTTVEQTESTTAETAQGTTAQAEEEATAVAATAKTPDASVDEPVEKPEPAPEPEEIKIDLDEEKPLSVAERLAARPSSLKISKAKVVEDESLAIRQAYEAYQSGSLIEAKARYQEFLQRYPDNRDGLLGLAAVAIKESDVETATAIYAHLLSLNPQDSIARTALIGLQNNQLAGKGESEIKNMLFAQPENPFLYFTLGKIYASQQRWPDAQQSFFDAYRLDSDNPGYALNLAISLDRLGQAKAALDYYNVALDLSTERGGAIDENTVRSRVQALSAQVQP